GRTVGQAARARAGDARVEWASAQGTRDRSGNPLVQGPNPDRGSVVVGRLHSGLEAYPARGRLSVVRQGKGDHEIWESPINGHRFPVEDRLAPHGECRPEASRLAEAVLRQLDRKYRPA